MSQININGSIGYSFLSDKKYNILILADIHSELPYCKTDGIFISDWLDKKKTSKLLLEEVPRINIKLQELWPTSEHTQKLKEIYIKKNDIIHGIDIRPFLLPMSWEIIESNETMILKDYIRLINDFLILKLEFPTIILKTIYTSQFLSNSMLGIHFIDLKNKMISFVNLNENLLNVKIIDIKNDNDNILEEINTIISDIMEWFIIAKIYQSIMENMQNIIIHAGLFHTTNIIDLLQKYYKYSIIQEGGITNMSQIDKPFNGCLHLPTNINEQFGGNKHYGFYNN